MSERGQILFVERQMYRRRRLIDWIRVLPVIGLALWMLPLLWASSPDESVSTSDALIFIFGTWLLLVIIAGVAAFALKRLDQQRLEQADGTTDPERH